MLAIYSYLGMIALFLLCTLDAYAYADEIRDMPWYKSAKTIVDSEKELWRIPTDGTGNASESIEKRNNALAQLKSYKNIDMTELSSLLESKTIIDKQIAIATMKNLKINDKALLKKAMKTIEIEDDFFVRLYFFKYFLKLDTDISISFKNEYFNILNDEDNEIILFYALPMLSKINSKEVVDYFCKYLTTGSDNLVKVSKVYLKKLDEKYTNEILTKCGKNGRYQLKDH